MLMQAEIWQQNACRIAAALELDGVKFIDFFGPAALFSNHICRTEKELSSRRLDLVIGALVKAVGRGKAKGKDHERKLIRASNLLGIDVSHRVAAYEQWYKEPFPQMSAHEQLESVLQFRERLEKHCYENGVPVPPHD